MSIVLNLNQAILGGRLAFDPDYYEERRSSSPDNTPLMRCRLRIAVTREMQLPDGSRKTDFFNAVVFGKKAPVIATYFKKGDPVVLFGSFHTDTYTDKNGNQKESITLMVKDFQFVERPKNTTDEEVKK